MNKGIAFVLLAVVSRSEDNITFIWLLLHGNTTCPTVLSMSEDQSRIYTIIFTFNEMIS